MPQRPAAHLAICTALGQPSAVAVAACSYDLSRATEADGLTLMQFTPAGEFGPSDGRKIDVPSWRIDAASAQAVIARHAARKQPVVIDYEHQTLHKEKNGLPAPAAGWLRELRWVEGQGLFGAVALTARARAAIDALEYLYFSPVFLYSPVDGTVLEIRMGALTNDPGIHGMPPLSLMAAATAAFLPSTPPEPTVNPLLKALLAALGLPETTTEEAATAALTALGPLQARAAVATAACTALQLPDDATAEAVTAACTSLRTAAPAAPDPTKFVPVEALSQVQGQLAALTAQVQGDKAEAAIAAAKEDGRLISAEQEAHARATAKTHGLAALTAFLGVLTPVPALAGTQTGGKPPAGLAKGDAQLSADELAVCTSMGLTPDQYKAGAAA
jgi:phage I-like protein